MAPAGQPEVIEGTWEEISEQAPKFHGHRLRVIILPDGSEEETSERHRALTEWLKMTRPLVSPLVDDSRAAIYGEDEDHRFS
jgi:hypothetical protein